MIPEKFRRHFWYRLARIAPTGSLRRQALERLVFVEVAPSAYIGPAITVTPFGGPTPTQTLLTVSDRATISPNVTLLCSMHPEEANLPGDYGERSPITVGRDAWIGADATILGGVSIGAESIVAAGAVVTDDVPPGTVVGGVPAKPLKRVGDHDE